MSVTQAGFEPAIPVSEHPAQIHVLDQGATGIGVYLAKLNILIGLTIIKKNTTVVCNYLTHCGRVTQICVFNTVKLGTSASSP